MKPQISAVGRIGHHLWIQRTLCGPKRYPGIQAVRVVDGERDRRQLGSAALNWCTARVMMSQSDHENDHGLG
jgi:hypothetical protein